MRSGFYMSTTHASANESNPEDLPEPEPKNDLHPKKVMLSVWWDFEGTGWLKSFESDTFLPVEESKFIRYFNISSSI